MGTDSARMAQYLLKIRSVFQPTNDALLRHITPPSESLHHQIEQFVAIQDKFHMVVYYEMYETPIIGSKKTMVGVPLRLPLSFTFSTLAKFLLQVVDKMSAHVSGTPNVVPEGLHKNHITMAKFPSREDSDYATVSGHIWIMVRDITEKGWQGHL